MTVRLAGGEVRAHTITFKLSRTLGWETMGVFWCAMEQKRGGSGLVVGELGPPRLVGQLHKLTPADGTMCSLAPNYFFLDEQSLHTKHLCSSDKVLAGTQVCWQRIEQCSMNTVQCPLKRASLYNLYDFQTNIN